MLSCPRPRRPRIWTFGLGVGALLALMPASPIVAAEFTADQRQAIEAIIRDYLQKNPEALLDALQAAEDKVKGEAHDKASAELAARRHEVFADPDAPVNRLETERAAVAEFTTFHGI